MTLHARSQPVTPSNPRSRPWEISTRGEEQSTRFLVWKALLGLLAFDVLGFDSNFAKMHLFVSRWKVAQRKTLGDKVGRVCEAINYACIWYPKRVLCLQRSAVTTCLLRHCGVPARMVMGAQSLPFKAHAWTEVDGHAINERRDVQKIYGVLERC
jgi:hypothetical protein